MNQCMNKECNTHIMVGHTHCGRCERTLARKAKKVQKKRSSKKLTNRSKDRGMFGPDGRVRPGMGLRRLAREDAQRRLAQSFVTLGDAISAFVDDEESWCNPPEVKVA